MLYAKIVFVYLPTGSDPYVLKGISDMVVILTYALLRAVERIIHGLKSKSVLWYHTCFTYVQEA